LIVDALMLLFVDALICLFVDSYPDSYRELIALFVDLM
jgi:hypothetical protein